MEGRSLGVMEETRGTKQLDTGQGASFRTCSLFGADIRTVKDGEDHCSIQNSNGSYITSDRPSSLMAKKKKKLVYFDSFVLDLALLQ
jgi:hypothetical protein